MKKGFICFFLLSFSLFPLGVRADDFLEGAFLDTEKIATQAGYPATSSDQPQADLVETIVNVIKIILTFLGAVMLIIVLYAGFRYMTAGGNQEQTKEALNWIKNAVIGMLIILSAYAITVFVLGSLLDAVMGPGQ